MINKEDYYLPEHVSANEALKTAHHAIYEITDTCYDLGELYPEVRRLFLSFNTLNKLAKEGNLPDEWIWQENKAITFTRAADVARAYTRKLTELDHEEFFALLIDAKNRSIGLFQVARGRVTECEVSTREAYAEAVKRGAASIIFMHNHPSGVPDPSPEDVALTARLQAAGALLDVPMLDHIIIAREGYYSFAEKHLFKIGETK